MSGFEVFACRCGCGCSELLIPVFTFSVSPGAVQQVSVFSGLWECLCFLGSHPPLRMGSGSPGCVDEKEDREGERRPPPKRDPPWLGELREPGTSPGTVVGPQGGDGGRWEQRGPGHEALLGWGGWEAPSGAVTLGDPSPTSGLHATGRPQE